MIAKLYLVETKDDEEMRSFGFPVRQFSRQRREILRRYILWLPAYLRMIRQNGRFISIYSLQLNHETFT